MKKILASISVLALFAMPVFAQQNQTEAQPGAEAEEAYTPPTEQEVERAVKAINNLANNDEASDAYCEILDDEANVKEGDTAAEEAVGKKLDAYLAGLGEDARLAFDMDETIDRASPEGQKLGGAFLNLEDQCIAEEADGNEASEG